ncbi:hypothetical protein IMSHALPRED_009552 [Imshaugia aleurites]|uniref:RGS domain-containing protein n=1 Tax=Imshaugia aleurites TaxID=172621 RepID=A0A8H3G6P8_9LECA|nr:hypothetical protein IMSHALPRED_009552 [Imshaugia aleurites]
MSLITREMAAQNGKTNGDLKQKDDRLLHERAGNTQLMQRKGSYKNTGDELSRDYNAPPSSYSVPKQNGSFDKNANGLADFFSTEVFQIVLHNPTTAHRLLKFSQARMCGENMEFLEKVDRYNALLDELTTVMTDIHYSYTATEAPKQLGIHVNLMRRMNADIKASTTSTLPSMESIFTEAQEHVENILRTAVYPRFVKYQMTNSASKALSTDRTKYQGLGDCFCLTDPNKADNPIVFASDGFVSVTGYSRPEVVPRNCRFLQGNYTDQTATKRLKASIEAREETVELLLNYKKTGEPFWNLLYVAPLFDAEGSLKFFIGGQINCSTTIRSNTDVLKILSMSDDPEDDKEAGQSVRSIKPNKRSFFKFSRKESIPQLPSSTKRVEVRGDGMEQGLLKQIEKMNFRTQMEVFYTAYSKYLVVKYDSFAISHYSLGIVDVLGITNKSSHDFVGSNIFKFLAQYTTALPREYKSKVKDALKHGQAISASINLFTLRSLARSKGDDKFFTHWTPCKDERGLVAYVVVTLSSTLYE